MNVCKVLVGWAREADMYIHQWLLCVHDTLKHRTGELAAAVSSCTWVVPLLSGIGTALSYMARDSEFCNWKCGVAKQICYFGLLKRSINVAAEIKSVLVFVVSDLSYAVESLWRSYKGKGSYSKTEKSVHHKIAILVWNIFCVQHASSLWT